VSHNHLPSLLWLPRNEKSIQLRFNGEDYELTLLTGRAHAAPLVSMAPEQVRRVTIELNPFEAGPMKIGYEDRCFVIRLDGEVWARVPDIRLMQLHSYAARGMGESVRSK
jgi:hypothetical protein